MQRAKKKATKKKAPAKRAAPAKKKAPAKKAPRKAKPAAKKKAPAKRKPAAKAKPVKAPKRGRGRPPKLTPTRHKRIERALNGGGYKETAAALAGIERGTLLAWVKRGSSEILRVEEDPTGKSRLRSAELPYVDFSRMVERALAEGEDGLLAGIKKHGLKHWQALAWILERRHREHWGPPSRDARVDVAVGGGAGERTVEVHAYFPDNERGDMGGV